MTDGGRGVLTQAANTMRVVDRPPAPSPGPGQVLIRPEAVGVCGSDFHFLTGELATPPAFGPQFPRVQGHEVAGTVVAAGGDVADGVGVGQRVAVWPLSSCGACSACRSGRGNACPNFRLIGVHTDGALQSTFVADASQVFPVGDLEPAVAAFCEPLSIAVHALARGRVAPGEHVVALGGGPIGQAVALAAQQRGARVLVTDLVPARLDLARRGGAATIDVTAEQDVAAAARAWAGGDGPELVVDCTGVPAAIRGGVDMVAPTGRVVIVGISHTEVSLPVDVFTQREIDVLGATVCDADDFAEAVTIAGQRADHVRRLITHRRPLEEAPEAIAHAMAHPADVMKLVITPGAGNPFRPPRPR
jgi:2-desacetyl-2-hydroxyethyl bacteriochlorophyllide A dehydrogenase